MKYNISYLLISNSYFDIFIFFDNWAIFNLEPKKLEPPVRGSMRLEDIILLSIDN